VLLLAWLEDEEVCWIEAGITPLALHHVNHTHNHQQLQPLGDTENPISESV